MIGGWGVDLFDRRSAVRHASEDRGTRVWLITFTDLMALMLTFFVMLFAMSSVKVTEWRSVIDSLSQTLRPEQDKTIPAPTSAFNIGTIFRRQASDLDYLTAILTESLDGQPQLAEIRLLRLEDRMVIALPGRLMFEPGDVVLTEAGRKALFVLGGVLRNIGNRIGVNGHTGAGDAPGTAPGTTYGSGWELSVARAAAVANALRGAGYTEPIIAYGYGDGRDGLFAELAGDFGRVLQGGIQIVVRPEAGTE